MRPSQNKRSGKGRVPKDGKGVAMLRGRTCEQVVADLRTGAIDRTTTQGQLAVKHLLEQAARIGGKMVRSYHTSEQKLIFAYMLTELLLTKLNKPTERDALGLEEDFAGRVGNFMKRVFEAWKKGPAKDAMTHLSGFDVDLERMSDGVDLEDRLSAEQEERERAAAEARLAEPAASIVRLHDQGLSNVDVAKELEVSEGTVRYHLRKHRPKVGRRRTK